MSRLARQLDRRAKHGIERVRRKVEGGQAYTIAALPLLDALVDARLGVGAAELLTAAYACVGTAGAERECLVCRRLWSLERAPVVLVELDFFRADEGLLALVCGDCARGPDLAAAILAGVTRDFGGDGHRIITLPKPGHA